MWDFLQDALGGGLWPRMLLVLLDTGAKGLILMAAAGLAAVALRRKAAAARHLVWMLALGGLLLLPAVSLIAPKWTLPILPAIEQPAPVVQQEPTAPTPIAAHPLPEVASAPATPTATPTATPMPLAPPAAAPAALPIESMGPVASPTAAPAPVNHIAWFLAAWLAVTMLCLAPFAAGLVAVARMRRSATAFSDTGLETLAAALGQTIGLKRPARLLCGPSGSMPMATGFIRSAVFLPADALAWTEEKRRVVLLHELAHVKRRDCLAHAIARMAVSLHWFNPLAWLALRQLRIEREHACDDLVIAAGERPSAYAENLLEIARTLRANSAVSAAAITMAQKSQLEGRLLAVLDAARNRGRVTKRLVAGSTFTALLVVGMLSAVEIARSEADDSEGSTKAGATPKATTSPAEDAYTTRPTFALFNVQSSTRPSRDADLPALRDPLMRTTPEGTVWGPVHFGLQAALMLLPEKPAYVVGEKISMEYLVRNAGDLPLEFVTTSVRQGHHGTVADTAGKALRRAIAMRSYFGGINYHRIRLYPGQCVGLRGDRFMFVPAEFSEEIEHHVSAWRVTEPGPVTVQFAINLPDFESSGGLGEPRPDDWKGTLTTGKRTINIVEESEATTAAGTLEVRWAAEDSEAVPAATVPWRPEAIRSGNDPEELRLHEEVLLSAQDIATVDVTPGHTPGLFDIHIQLTADGGERWARITGENIGRQVAMVINGEVAMAPTVRSRITGGHLAISGAFSESQAREFAADIYAANPAIRQPEKRDPFGPEIEVTIRHSGENCMIDFDTGKLFTPPDFDGTADALAWIAKNGIDVAGADEVGELCLAGMDMVLHPESNATWEAASAHALLNHDAFKFGAPGNPIYFGARARPPATWSFKTRSGGMGILQILAFEREEPRGVKIRYRMLEGAATEP